MILVRGLSVVVDVAVAEVQIPGIRLGVLGSQSSPYCLILYHK